MDHHPSTAPPPSPYPAPQWSHPPPPAPAPQPPDGGGPSRHAWILAILIGGPAASGLGAAVGSTADSAAIAALTESVGGLQTATAATSATVSARLESLAARVSALEAGMAERTRDRYTSADAARDRVELERRLGVVEDRLESLHGGSTRRRR